MIISTTLKTYHQTFSAIATCLALMGWVIGFAAFACLVSPDVEQRLEYSIVDAVAATVEMAYAITN